jgi:lipoprotein-anchoring transpeptidase ErfK/SrfK
VRRQELRSGLDRALRRAGAARRLALPTESVRPRVTRGELAERYPYFITIDRARFRLHFYRRLRRVKTYVIGVGQSGYETPEGLYDIQNKAVNPAWSVPNSPWAGALAGQVIPPGPDNPIKARWMGIYDGAGIHGTADTWSLGTAASHGCIRMAIPEVKELYRQVPVGTPVYIG